MLMDKNGKLFGKINIIDLALILVVVMAVGFVGYKYMKPKQEANVGQKIEMKFYSEELPDYVADKVKIGDVVADDSRNVAMGKVTKVEIGNSVGIAYDSNGKFVEGTKPGYKSILITAEVKGQLYENGAIVGTVKYGIGHSMTLRAGKAKIYLRVRDIN